MAETIGDVAVRIGADTSGLTRGLSDADKSLQGFGARAAAVAGKVAAITAGAVAASAAVGLLVKAQIDLADAAGDSAQKAGISVEEWSKLSYAFRFGTKEGTDLNQTLMYLNKAISGAGDGLKANVDDFRALGVAYRNTDGTMRNTSAVLDDVADAFAKMPDGADKAAIAMRLFGKSGADIIPFLNEGSAGIRKLKDEAERLGQVISQDTSDAAGQFNDNIERISAGIEGTARSLAAELLPSLADFSDSLIENGGYIDELKGHMDEIKVAIEVAAAVIAGRLVASVTASGLAFAAAQIEALRYQATLARMAGASGVAGAAMTGFAGAGRAVMGLMGGPVGLAVAVASLGLSLIDFSHDTDAATMSAKDFDERLASITGNTDKLRDSQRKLKLQQLMGDMQAVSDQINAINREAELSNTKLGKGEIERIQMLQGRLAELGKAYQDVANDKAAAAAPTAQSPDAPTAPENDKRQQEMTRLMEQARQAYDNFGLTTDQVTLKRLKDLGATQQQIAATRQYMEAVQSATAVQSEMDADFNAAIAGGGGANDRLEALSKQFDSQRELELKRYQQQLADFNEYADLRAMSEEDRRIKSQDLEQQHQDNLRTIEQASFKEKLDATKGVFGQLSVLMNSHSRKQFELGKAAALAGATINAYEAIAGAYASGAKIGGPVLGSAFAVAAGVAQFATIANIRKQQFGGGGGSASAGSVTTAVNNANTPVSPGGNAPTQRTNITLVGDVFSREAVIGLLQQSMRDGYSLDGV